MIMIDLEAYLYERIKPIINSWDEPGIYAISFFLDNNMAIGYEDYFYLTNFTIGYNTESDCEHAPAISEERWNYAFWRQEGYYIIDCEEEEDEGRQVLFDWYEENGIHLHRAEDGESMQKVLKDMTDEHGYFLPGEPRGYWELVSAASHVARRLQDEGFIRERFGPIPILVHELEYYDRIKEATVYANPNGEAADFIHTMYEE